MDEPVIPGPVIEKPTEPANEPLEHPEAADVEELLK